MRLNRPTNILTNGRLFPSTTAAESYATNDIVNASYIGKRVCLNSGKEGTLRFIGATNFGRGVWCGIELDAEDGTTDGMVNKVRYFSCPPSRGIFALVSKVRPAKPSKKTVHGYFSDISDSGSHSMLGIGDAIEFPSVDDDETTSIERVPFHDKFFATFSQQYSCHSQSAIGPDTPSVQMRKSDSLDYDESLGILTPDEMSELTAHSNDVTILANDEPQLSPANVDPELPDPLQRLPNREKSTVDQQDNLATTLMTARKCDETFTITAATAAGASATSFVTSVTSIGSWDNGYQGDGECSRPTSRGAIDASPLSPLPKIIATSRPSPDPPTDSDFYTESDYEETKMSKYGVQGDRRARIIDGKLFGSPPIATKLAQVSWSRNSPIFTKETSSLGQEQSKVPDEMDSSGIYSDLEKRPQEEIKERTEEATDENSSEASLKSITSRSYARVDEDAHSRKTKESGKERVESAKVEMRKSSAKVKSHNVENALKRPAKCNESSSVKSTTATKVKIARQNVTICKAKTGTISTSSNGCCEDENQENHQPATSSTKVGAKKTNVGRWDAVLVKVEKGQDDVKTKTDRSKEGKSKVGCDQTARMASSKLHKDVKVFSSNANTMNKAATVPGKRPPATLSDTTKLSKNGTSSYRIAKSRKTRSRTQIDSSVRSVSVSCSKNLESVTSSHKSSIIDISDSRVDISQPSTPMDVIPTHAVTKYVKDTKSSSRLSTSISDTAVSIPLHSDLMATKITKMSSLSLPRTKSAVSKQIGSVNSLIEDLSTNAESAPLIVPRKTTQRPTQLKVSAKVSNRALPTNGCVKNNPSLKSSHDENNRQTPSVDICKLVDNKTEQLNQISKINPLLVRLKYATDGMEAFIILFQSLTFDTDVFALDRIKRELSKSKKDCSDMKMKLEEANASYKRLKDEIETERSIHERKLKELSDIHSAKVDRLNENQKQELEEHLSIHKTELKKLENELKNREDALRTKYDEDLRTLRKQAEQKLDNILQETKSQVELLKIENEAWKDKLIEESQKKLQNVDTKYKNEMRIMETNYTSQLDQMVQLERKRKETVAKFSARSGMSNKVECISTSNRNIKSSDVEIEARTLDVQNVENEICSLRTVLELKHGEIQELRKQNETFKKAVQDLPFVEQKLYSVQARVEDLSAQLETKVEIEKKLLKENRRLLDTIQYENEKKKRLAFQNEELWWKLKNSTQVAKTLAVYNGSKDEINTGPMLAHSTPFHRKGPSLKSLKRSRTEDDIKLIESSGNENGDISSKILGVVEKNDSVSWVLEINESPVVVASRMLKRANSLKGISSKRRSKTQHKLHHSLSVPSGGQNDSGTTTTVNSTSHASSTSNRQKMEIENDDVENSKLLKNAEVGKLEDKLRAADVATFFNFPQDSDSEEMDLVARENGEEGEFGLPSSNTTSSDSSLELDGYNVAAYHAYSPRTVWNTSQVKSSNDETLGRVESDLGNIDDEFMAYELQTIRKKSKARANSTT